MALNSEDHRAAHWRTLANDVLIAASETSDPKTKAMLVAMAVSYTQLAVRAETRNTKTPSVTETAEQE
jgi:hypothetical protein